MNGALVVEGDARAHVAPFDQGHTQAAGRGVVGREQAVDAAADHEQVERIGLQSSEVASHTCHIVRRA